MAAPFCVPAVGLEDCYGVMVVSRRDLCFAPDRRRIGRVWCRLPRGPKNVVFGPGDRCVQGRGQVCAGSGLQEELYEELYDELCEELWEL